MQLLHPTSVANDIDEDDCEEEEGDNIDKVHDEDDKPEEEEEEDKSYENDDEEEDLSNEHDGE